MKYLATVLLTALIAAGCDPVVTGPVSELVVRVDSVRTGLLTPPRVHFTVSNRTGRTLFVRSCDGRVAADVVPVAGGVVTDPVGGSCLTQDASALPLEPAQRIRGVVHVRSAGTFRLRVPVARRPQTVMEQSAASRTFLVPETGSAWLLVRAGGHAVPGYVRSVPDDARCTSADRPGTSILDVGSGELLLPMHAVFSIFVPAALRCVYADGSRTVRPASLEAAGQRQLRGDTLYLHRHGFSEPYVGIIGGDSIVLRVRLPLVDDTLTLVLRRQPLPD